MTRHLESIAMGYLPDLLLFHFTLGRFHLSIRDCEVTRSLVPVGEVAERLRVDHLWEGSLLLFLFASVTAPPVYALTRLRGMNCKGWLLRVGSLRYLAQICDFVMDRRIRRMT